IEAVHTNYPGARMADGALTGSRNGPATTNGADTSSGDGVRSATVLVAHSDLAGIEEPDGCPRSSDPRGVAPPHLLQPGGTGRTARDESLFHTRGGAPAASQSGHGRPQRPLHPPRRCSRLAPPYLPLVERAYPWSGVPSCRET